MVLILALFAIAVISLIFCAIFSKGKIRKVSIAISILIFLVPFVGLFKSNIQQGEFLSDFGPILILIAPPNDLWEPLGKVNLNYSKTEYQFEFTHKYVGNHVVDLSFNKLKVMEMAENNFEIEYVVSNGEKILFSQRSNKGWSYWGENNSGINYISYKVPQELPVNAKLFATVKVKGDISSFIKKYGPTRLSIRKGSDK